MSQLGISSQVEFSQRIHNYIPIRLLCSVLNSRMGELIPKEKGMSRPRYIAIISYGEGKIRKTRKISFNHP